MALHPDFPESPHEIIDPAVRWLPDNQTLRETDYEKLLPHLFTRFVSRSKCGGITATAIL